MQRKVCLALCWVVQEVVFKVDYAVPSIHREFGSVFMGSTNMALDVVAAGWAKVGRRTTQLFSRCFFRMLARVREQRMQPVTIGGKEFEAWREEKVPGTARGAVRPCVMRSLLRLLCLAQTIVFSQWNLTLPSS